MDTSSGFKGSFDEAPDIEWRAASADAALFALLDQLKREKRAMATRERPQFGIVALRRRAKSPRLA
jgi:hypothetical protein